MSGATSGKAPRRRRRCGRGFAIAVAVAVLFGAAGVMAFRGDWRYRVLYFLTPVRVPELSAAEMPDGGETRTRGEWLSDARVTVSDALRLINRAHPLEDGYQPVLVGLDGWEMTAQTREAFEALRERVLAQTGERLLIRSAYRNFGEQQDELDAAGETVAARPGESEHEAGLGLDVCVKGYGGMAFLKTAAGRLVNRTCAEEGFIIRYPLAKETVTGFGFEPWHLRYVGIPHAQVMSECRLTLEEYLGMLTPDCWIAVGEYRILRTAEESVSLPSGFTSCSVSPDGCGYWIFSVRM